MFRRRPIRRLTRSTRPGPRPRVHRALVLANASFEAGDYAEATARFAAIAAASEQRGGLRAPQFYLQAGRAAMLDGQTEAGLAHLKRGLALLAGRGEIQRLHAAGQRIIAELEGRGLKEEAVQISAWLEGNLPDGFVAAHEGTARKALLPTHCPSCGAALRPDEVDWLDEITAECAYCGSPVRGGE
jgi:hypothetical protein